MNQIKDASNDKAYFIMTPRLVYSLARDPYEIAAWTIVKDVAGEDGECYLSTEDLALLSKMSVGKFSQVRQSLMDKGLLEGELRKDPGYPQPVWHLRVPDLWPRNVQYVEAYPSLKQRIARARFEKEQQSLHVLKASPHEEGPSPHEGKKNKKEEQLPPIGGGVVVHDLDEVAFHLEHSGRRKGDLEAQCPHCGAGHTQEINVCPDCQAHVVWLNSPTWKKRFGNPKVYLQEIEGQDLKAVGPLEVEFCRTFNYGTKFANQTQQKQFRALARKYPADYIRELMTWANGKGFQALKGAAENPDNLTKWQNKQYEETQPGETDEPSGWELIAIQATRVKG